MTIRARRLVAAGALAVAAVAAPVAIALTSAGSRSAQAQCLRLVRQQRGRQLPVGYSNGNATGDRHAGVGSTAAPAADRGFSTGPLLPGQTWNVADRLARLCGRLGLAAPSVSASIGVSFTKRRIG